MIARYGKAFAVAMHHFLYGQPDTEPDEGDDMQLPFDEHGHYVSPFCIPEQGPLRPSSAHLSPEKLAELEPGWAYCDHDELDYVTQSDHRSTTGKIISIGTPCRATRQAGVVQLRMDDGQLVVLEGQRWALLIEDAPVMSVADAPELFLPA